MDVSHQRAGKRSLDVFVLRSGCSRRRWNIGGRRPTNRELSAADAKQEFALDVVWLTLGGATEAAHWLTGWGNMTRPIDLERIRRLAQRSLKRSMGRYKDAVSAKLDYLMVRWTAQMTAVELHVVWERFAEDRLVAALNHDSSFFLETHQVLGITRVPNGLARFAVRGGDKYFDFRSCADLIDRADRLVGKARDPFRKIPTDDRQYLDVLSAIRNRVVHASDAAIAAYRRALRGVYGIRAAPEPAEFLSALDYKKGSPARRRSRLHGLALVLERTIAAT
jgi:hypothetical protein